VQTGGQRTAVVLHRYPLWRDALTRVLANAEIEVEELVSSVEDALERVAQSRPDLLVTAATIEKSGDGIECVSQARQLAPQLRAVVLGETYDEQEANDALAAGAQAYVIETTYADDIAAAIRQVFEPSVYLAKGHRPAPAPRMPSSAAALLTAREREILRLVAEGSSNAEVARGLWVTEQTVKFHLSNIYRKLGVSNRTEAGRWAQVNGLLESDARSHGSN
jgi:DNA-binding NarL/FixJ family response regulator